MEYIIDCELKWKTLLRGTAALGKKKWNHIQLFVSEEYRHRDGESKSHRSDTGIHPEVWDSFGFTRFLLFVMHFISAHI